jgi:hypothetical protein
MDSAHTSAEKPAQLCAPSTLKGRRWAVGWRVAEVALLLIGAVIFALHYVHLRADFPNRSPWMDWAKYTDEGWYGDAAIRHYELGHWNVPGDFNPAAALPVWPALELVLFRFTGVSLEAARALTVTVFGLILVCVYGLIRRWSSEATSRSLGESRRLALAPSIAMLLLAASPLCYVFSRLAILEPLLILLTLAALLAASSAGATGAAERTAANDLQARRARLRFAVWIVVLGLLLPMIVLTKTTGVFLFPAIFWLLLAAGGYRIRRFAFAAAAVCGIGIAAWGAYYLFFVHRHYLNDYRYLFSANAYTGMSLATCWQILHDAVTDISWIGETLYVLALIAILASIASVAWRRSRENPLVVALLLWIFGYGAFLTYHANLQPRYYLVIAVPATMLVAVFFDGLLGRAAERTEGSRFRERSWQTAAFAGILALLFVAWSGAGQVLGYVRHPQYEWWSAAQQVRGVVEREAAVSRAKGGVAHSKLLLSISGSDISLMTGLPSICDDFGTMALADRVATYRPGWFASWNDVEDDKMEALAPMFRLERVAAIPVFDDPDRNLLILYRLDPLSSPGTPGRPGRRRFLSVPHRLRVKIGEQPSPLQLEH